MTKQDKDVLIAKIVMYIAFALMAYAIFVPCNHPGREDGCDVCAYQAGAPNMWE